MLNSAYWPGIDELLADRQAQLSERLEVGSEPRLEDRLRGAIGALKWVRTVFINEVKAAPKES